VEQTLAGRQAELNEYAIALDVFRRPDSFDPRLDSTVRSEMSRLRRALAAYYAGAGSADPWQFEFSTRGYTPAFVKPAQFAVAHPSAPATPLPRGKILWAAAAVALVAVGVWAVYLAAAPGRIRSVVVLPFANLTGDPANEYLSDGMTEGLTDSLAHIASLRVVARTSAFQFKGKNTDIREIGRKVDADAVIEGSLRKVGDGMRVTVQVNRASDGFHILSRAFDGTARDLGRMERDLTLPVMAVLRPGTSLVAGHVPDAEAYDLVLRARALRGLGSAEALHQILDYLHRAVERDPQYANAYALLARAYVTAATNTLMDPSAAMPLAGTAVDTALALDPQSAVAWDAMGYGDAMLKLQWKKGEDELRRALRLVPQDATIHQHLGLVLLSQARFAEAISEMKTAATLDPLPPAEGATVGLAYFFARRYDDAVTQLRKMLRQHPEVKYLHSFLGQTYVAKGEYDLAMTEYRAAIAPGPSPSTLMVHLLAVTGKRAEALAQVRNFENTDYPDPNDLAAIYGALGDRDRAFAWLEKSLIKRKAYILKVHPFFDPLRSDPRFADLLKRTGFTP
jgi:TolB-like protein/Tfp pilus assembly protein PilF